MLFNSYLRAKGSTVSHKTLVRINKDILIYTVLYIHMTSYESNMEWIHFLWDLILGNLPYPGILNYFA